ncbi:fungal-specific transcription factor domain-containing protein [Thelonectria olida]|uniref:Fungal-specific transcription factor domain-containing protein n=1 Tax=Thelonectria olida TaxID=1576542 RepID=A0A9P9AGZ0_9HYPO|nr:fungal-specific transcription factor domain-containing protein [Thelonectria olida]
MFANFELYSAGWVTSDHTPKRRRSRRGCIPCRQRRKKCDEARPICGSCFSRQVHCCWRKTSPALDDALKYHQEHTGSQASASPSFVSSRFPSCDTESITSGAEIPCLSQGDSLLRRCSLNPSNVFIECTKDLPSCSLVDLLKVFDQATSGHDFGHEYSLLAQGFSSLSRSRSMLHAWLSCSAMLISQFQPSWRTHALIQYTEAIRELRINIRRGVDVEDESNFATVLILNVFGRFGDSGNNSTMVHLEAAARLYAAIDRPPSSAHQALVLEAFIYQIAINSTFRPSCLSNYQDLSRIIRLWSSSSALQQNADSAHFMKAGLSVWLPIWSFDIIFKASHLYHHQKSISSNDIQTKLHELQKQLNDLQREVSASTSAHDGHERTSSKDEPTFDGSGARIDGATTSLSDPAPSFPCTNLADEGFHMRELYFLATSLLIAKLACPTITAEDPSVASISKATLLHLRHVRSNLPCLLWAIAVLGIAVTSPEDRSVIVAHLEAMRHFAGERAISSVLRFLSSAWGPGARCFSISATDADSGDEFGSSARRSQQTGRPSEERFLLDRSLGLDVLFEESLLESVIL